MKIHVSFLGPHFSRSIISIFPVHPSHYDQVVGGGGGVAIVPPGFNVCEQA